MNALAILYVNAHLQDLLDDAAEDRQHQVDRPSLFDRISSAVSKALADLAIPLDNRGMMFPRLDESTNRS